MGLFNWFTGKSKRALTLQQGLDSGLVETPGRAGVIVNEQSALSVSAIFCAVKVISETVGSLPICMYRKGNEGREIVDDTDLSLLLESEPNPETTRNVFFQTLMANSLLWGNGFAEIERDNKGNPVNLWIVHPQYVQLLRDTSSGQLVYRIQVPYSYLGQPDQSGHVVYVKQEDMIHLRGLSTDSEAGTNLLKTCRDSISFSLAADRWGQSYFANAARLGGVLTHPGVLSDGARENLRRSFQASYQGVEKVGQTALLEEGLQFEPYTVRNDQAELNDTRMFELGTVCRLFNISPVFIQNYDRATWANFSVAMTHFYTITIRPWLETLESELERKLLTRDERKTLYLEFNADALTRGDRLTRMQIYQLAITTGVYTVDECREAENLPPSPVTPVAYGNVQQAQVVDQVDSQPEGSEDE